MNTRLNLPAPILGFIPPLEGFDSRFNTIRLGKAWSKRVSVGQLVILMDVKGFSAFGLARVEAVDTGMLAAMCGAYGYLNHSQIGKSQTEAPAAVMQVIVKMFGPHIATPTKLSTVVTLQRIA